MSDQMLEIDMAVEFIKTVVECDRIPVKKKEDLYPLSATLVRNYIVVDCATVLGFDLTRCCWF